MIHCFIACIYIGNCCVAAGITFCQELKLHTLKVDIVSLLRPWLLVCDIISCL